MSVVGPVHRLDMNDVWPGPQSSHSLPSIMGDPVHTTPAPVDLGHVPLVASSLAVPGPMLHVCTHPEVFVGRGAACNAGLKTVRAGTACGMHPAVVRAGAMGSMCYGAAGKEHYMQSMS